MGFEPTDVSTFFMSFGDGCNSQSSLISPIVYPCFSLLSRLDMFLMFCSCSFMRALVDGVGAVLLLAAPTAPEKGGLFSRDSRGECLMGVGLGPTGT